MSKLKEMKFAQTQKKESSPIYTLIAVVLVLGFLAAIAYALFSPAPKFDLSEIEKTGHAKGNPSAKVHIIEFSDFQCPACGAAYPSIKRILSEFGDGIYLVYKHFPLSSIHKYAQKAAEASECAAEQGKFYEMHDKLFENQDNLKNADLRTYAASIGLDAEQFGTCLETGKYAGKVAKDFSEGVALGVNSTPTYFINGEKFSGLSYDELKNIVSQKS